MLVVQSFGHVMEVPVELLKFDPDPLGLTAGDYECPCPACRLQRRLAELHAQEGGMEVVGVSGESAAAITKTAVPITSSPPAITAFDVHGAPERKSPERAAHESAVVSAESRQLVTRDGKPVPPWLVRAVHVVAWCIAIPLWPFVWLAMSRRPRLRVLRIEDAA
jgi:hypothetical protein